MIYYVRHGESEDNIYNIVTGINDVALTKKGLEQARKTAKELKSIHFDACYISPLIRAKQTANEILAFHTYLIPVYDERLKERNYGKANGFKKEDFKFDEYENRYKIGYKSSIKGLESVEELLKRVKGFFDEVKNKHKEKNVLIVGHGGYARAAYCYFNGVPKNGNLIHIEIENAKVMTFNFPENELSK